MALTKRLYKEHETVITAQNMNDIQDSILALEQMAGIVPGEGETTKVINVINSAGTMTPASAARLGDGLYWMDLPLVFQDAGKTDSFEVSGLAAKNGLTWVVYATSAIGTTDDTGVLLEWSGPDLGGPQVTNVAVVKNADGITVTGTLKDGGEITNLITLDANGYPDKIVTDDLGVCTIGWEGFDE